MKRPYEFRPVRFIGLYQCGDFQVKIYSISTKDEFVSVAIVEHVKLCLPGWLKKRSLYGLECYAVATLILHEAKEGCFAIITWWTDETMLQLFAYLATNDQPYDFQLFSDRGIVTCVWEMAVLWFERESWVKHVLRKQEYPDLNAYLNDHFNADV